VSKTIRFTKHAEQKFNDLAEIGFTITREQVLTTVQNPEKVDNSVIPPVAQSVISETHVLRVVFAESSDEIVIVTFYPGDRKRYEDEI